MPQSTIQQNNFKGAFLFLCICVFSRYLREYVHQTYLEKEQVPKDQNFLSERLIQPIVAMGSLTCVLHCTLMKFDRIFLSNTGYLFSNYVFPLKKFNTNFMKQSTNTGPKTTNFTFLVIKQMSFGDVCTKIKQSLMSLVSHQKNYFVCDELSNFGLLRNIYLFSSSCLCPVGCLNFVC